MWLIRYKKVTGKPRFDYEVDVEEALCFGWIDSKPNKLDEERSMLRHAALVCSGGERALGYKHHGDFALRVSHRIGRAL